MSVTLPAAVKPGPALTDFQRQQYQRQIILPGFTEIAQRRLLAARVLIVGAGGLGTPALQYLAAAGVGHIGIIDDDLVDVTNLHRQVLHLRTRLGWHKTKSAAQTLRELNPDVQVIEHRLRLDESNIDEVISDYDLVIDGADNFPTRYLVADACASRNIPEVWGTIFQYSAQVSIFWKNPAPGITGRVLRDLFPVPPAPGSVPSCAQAGVLGSFCGQVGSLMATEAIKVITGIGSPAFGEVLVLEALSSQVRRIPFAAGAGSGGTGSESGGTGSGSGGTGSGSAEPAAEPATSATEPARLHSPTEHTEREVSATQLQQWLRGYPGQFEIWDLRDEADWEGGVIAGARTVSFDDALDQRVKLPEVPVVLYCHSGARSYQVAAIIQSETPVFSLQGGIEAWWATPGTVTTAPKESR